MHDARALTGPGLLLGVGLGGFVDGIVLHQILQWHHMLSSEHSVGTVAGLEANTLADGLFHAFAWLAVLAGVVWLTRVPPPWKTPRLLGLMLAGWGAFNVVEGLVDHQLLGLHHVREGVARQGLWDAAFLLLGAAQLVVGALLARRGGTPVSRAAPRAAPR